MFLGGLRDFKEISSHCTKWFYNQFQQTAPGALLEKGPNRKGCMGIGEASGQEKMLFLTVGHFCGSESKLVSTIEKNIHVLEILPSIKKHLQWGVKKQ